MNAESRSDLVQGFEPEFSAHEEARSLRGKQFNRVCILDQPSISSVIAGFILTEVGIISPNAQLTVRSDPNKEQLSRDLQRNSIPLYLRAFSNPGMLLDLINDGASPLDGRNLNQLRWLAQQLETYRAFHEAEWLLARPVFGPNQSARRSVHDILSLIFYSNRDNPKKAYQEAQAALRRLKGTPTDRDILAPVSLHVPFLKGYETPDTVKYADYSFDRRRILLLVEQNFSMVIGGSPNSGKSTFAVSLFEAMQQIVSGCVQDGIVGPDDLSIGICDLDLAAPTVQYIQEKRKAPANRKQRWTEPLMDQAVYAFEECQRKHNIVIGDLPGGVPDRFTRRLAALANFSAWVYTTKDDKAEQWSEFLRGADLPTKLIEVHTRLEEPGRESGVRNYEARNRGHRRDFLKGRAVDLKRISKSDDDFIRFAAHTFLLDYLPDQVLGRFRYGFKITDSLGMTKPTRSQKPTEESKRVSRLLAQANTLNEDEQAAFVLGLNEIYGLNLNTV